MKTDCMRDSRICRQQSTTTASRTSVWRNDKPSSSADVNAGMRRIVSGISRPRKLTEESNSHAVTNCREWSEALHHQYSQHGQRGSQTPVRRGTMSFCRSRRIMALCAFYASGFASCSPASDARPNGASQTIGGIPTIRMSGPEIIGGGAGPEDDFVLPLVMGRDN